jgi:hypothetical protein
MTPNKTKSGKMIEFEYFVMKNLNPDSDNNGTAILHATHMCKHSCTFVAVYKKFERKYFSSGERKKERKDINSINQRAKVQFWNFRTIYGG